METVKRYTTLISSREQRFAPHDSTLNTLLLDSPCSCVSQDLEFYLQGGLLFSLDTLPANVLI